MLRCRLSVSFSSYGTSRKPIYQKGDKEDKQEASVSRATAKEISMDATVAAVIAKLDSIFFFSVYLKNSNGTAKCRAGCLHTGYAGRH